MFSRPAARIVLDSLKQNCPTIKQNCYVVCFQVNSRGRAGGLSILWKEEEVSISIQSYLQFHIDMIVHSSVIFRFTLFYRHPEQSKRVLGWNLLRFLHTHNSLPWLLSGDFNEVISVHETSSGRRNKSQMLSFREVLATCNLSDLGFNGYPFIFSNRRKGIDKKKARLDRSVANSSWRLALPNARVTHLTALTSDHAPILTDLYHQHRPKMKQLFKFEPMWFRHAEFTDYVKNAWTQLSSREDNMACHLKSLGTALQNWILNILGMSSPDC